MNYRDYLQQLIYKIINPLIHGMIKIGITPNFITTTGFILNVVAAGMFVYAGICGGQNDLSILGSIAGNHMLIVKIPDRLCLDLNIRY